MSWFKVDDKLWGHQKWVSAPPGARALWVTAGSWAADHLTDGFIPTHLLGIFGARLGDSRKLVEIGLWEVCDGGWRFRDWLDFQPSRESVLADREKARQRQQAARERAKLRAQSRRDTDVTDGVTTALVTDLSQDPDPTRPDPTVVPTELPRGRGRAERGTRIPEDFRITPELRVWSSENVPGMDIDFTTKKFIHHFQAQSGQRGTMINWDAAWKKWMLGDYKPANQNPIPIRGYGRPGERKSLI